MKSKNIKQHHTIEERVENFNQFYSRENKRPLFGFTLGSEYPLFRYNAAKKLPEDRPIKPEDLVVKGYMEDYDRLFKKHELCGGDFIWTGSAFWGIPWLEAALGCPIYANHLTGSVYSKPLEGRNCVMVKSFCFNENSPWVLKAKEFLIELRNNSNGRWPIGTTRMRGISDLLYAIYGSENFIYLMFEKPDVIKKVCAELTKFWINFGKLQLDNIPLFYNGVGSFFYNMWAPKGTIWCQEDAAALLSPKLYEDFIQPCVKKIVNSFPSCIIHQHSTGFVPTRSYIQIGMTALEMHVDEGGPSAEELYDTHMMILKEKPLLIWGNISNEDLDWIFLKLPYKGLAVNTMVNDVKEADKLWERYLKYSPKWR